MMNKGQLAGLMKQAQQMQDNMRKMQEQLASIEVEGQSGAGMVKVVMTCRHDVKRIAIDPSLLADDKEMLEDLVAAAPRGDEPPRQLNGPPAHTLRRSTRGAAPPDRGSRRRLHR